MWNPLRSIYEFQLCSRIELLSVHYSLKQILPFLCFRGFREWSTHWLSYICCNIEIARVIEILPHPSWTWNIHLHTFSSFHNIELANVIEILLCRIQGPVYHTHMIPFIDIVLPAGGVKFPYLVHPCCPHKVVCLMDAVVSMQYHPSQNHVLNMFVNIQHHPP